jgi:hypothetical protein
MPETRYDFRSDNVGGAAPEILEAVVAAASGTAAPYGDDEYTRAMNQRFAALFERPVQAFPLSSGTGSNSVALAALANPYGSVYCHETSHINVYECGAPEFFTGAKLVGLPGRDYRLQPDALDEALSLAGRGNPTRVQPFALNLTQPTDFGTLYSPAEVTALCEVAHRHGLRVHMDGARFANAIAALGCTPAELTWRAGVDVLSLGATKNGAINAEAGGVAGAARDPVPHEARRAGSQGALRLGTACALRRRRPLARACPARQCPCGVACATARSAAGGFAGGAGRDQHDLPAHARRSRGCAGSGPFHYRWPRRWCRPTRPAGRRVGCVRRCAGTESGHGPEEDADSTPTSSGTAETRSRASPCAGTLAVVAQAQEMQVIEPGTASRRSHSRGAALLEPGGVVTGMDGMLFVRTSPANFAQIRQAGPDRSRRASCS